MMDRTESYSSYDDRRRIGSAHAAITSSMKPSQFHFPESFSKARELHMARRDVARYNETRRAAESEKAEAESELVNARRTVKHLASLIEESNSKAKVEDLSNSSPRNMERYRYAQVRRELDFVKRELSKLKLGMASILEEKTRAQRRVEHSKLKIQSNSATVEALKKEIEAANEEHVLVELARIEAMKEAAQIQALREKESSQFSFSMEETDKKMEQLSQEIDQTKELEHKLAVTLADVSFLRNELKVAKEMDKRELVKPPTSFKQSEDSFQLAEGSETSHLLLSIKQELEAAKRELGSVREEGFQFMSSMDIIRNELKHVTEEIARLKKTEEKADLKAKSLNSKLLRAKSKFEAVSAAEEKAKSVLTNLSLTLEQLQTEAQASRQEKALISEETGAIKAEIQKTELEMDICEEGLQAAMQELEDAKSSEALALVKLKSLIETTMPARASVSQQNSTITISKFENEYLTGRAVGAEEIADKKVAAAQAWIEALKASEKEVLMKIEIAQRDLREIRMEEEREVRRSQRSLSAKRRVEKESRSLGQKHEKNTDEGQNLYSSYIRKSLKYTGKSTPSGSGQAKFRKSASPATRRSTPVIIKKKKKVMTNLARFFGGKKTSRDV